MRDVRVLFFGDSFVAGFGDPSGLGWVGRVAAGAFAAGLPLTAYNLGVRRETSSAVVQRWRTEARPRITPEADCRVVFSFGANDAAADDGTPSVAPAESVRALSQAVTDATRLGLPALVVGPVPVKDHDQRDRIGLLSESFADLCRQSGVPFIDVVEPLRHSAAWTREATSGDGAHPGAEGYSQLAQLVMRPVLSWLARPTAACLPRDADAGRLG